jgi:hypothetical protein
VAHLVLVDVTVDLLFNAALNVAVSVVLALAYDVVPGALGDVQRLGLSGCEVEA